MNNRLKTSFLLFSLAFLYLFSGYNSCFASKDSFTFTLSADSDLGPGSGSLRDAILQANASSETNITIIFEAGHTYSLTNDLPMVSNYDGQDPNASPMAKNWVFVGNGATLNANGHSAFFISPVPNDPTKTDVTSIADTTPFEVEINDLTISGATAQGGGGGAAGMGAGAAVFVNNFVTVTLDTVTFQNSQARGGNVGAMPGAVGGGGMRGNGSMNGGGGLAGNGSRGGGGIGGNGGFGPSVGSGGGGFGNIGIGQIFGTNFNSAGDGSVGAGGGTGGAGGANGGGGGGATDNGQTGGSGGDGTQTGVGGASNAFIGHGGGGGGIDGDNGTTDGGGNGGIGGGGGESYAGGYGGAGGFGGGGGGPGSIAGAGGFGGGGGAAGNGVGGRGGFGGGGGSGDLGGGVGGFGGGGARGNGIIDVAGGIGGGIGNMMSSGAGMGAGGAIFVRDQGQVIFKSTYNSWSESGSSVVAGTGQGGQGNGAAVGAALFVVGNNGVTDVIFQPSVGNSITIDSSIADDNIASIPPDQSYTQGNGSGGMRLVLEGPGMINLRGANTYAAGNLITQGQLNFVTLGNLGVGSTTLDGGKLQLDSSASGDITLDNITLGNSGGTFDNQSAHNLIISSPFTGSGGVKFTGGIITIDADNSSYNGDISVSSSATAVVANLAGLGNGSVINTGIVDISEVSGVISVGTANGNGTWQLGDNALHFTNGGSLAGPIEGNSGIVVSGNNPLTLSAASSYLGGTLINDSTLIVGDDAAIGTGSASFDNSTLKASNDVALSNALDFTGSSAIDNGGYDFTLSGEITGDADLSFNGIGTTTLTSDNSSFTGTATVASGTLFLDEGSAIGPLTVDSGAILQGLGTINGDLVNSGKVIPGDGGAGIMQVTGDYLPSSTGILQIYITAATDPLPGVDNSELVVEGDASLNNSTVLINPAPGSYSVGTEYTILESTTGTVNGKAKVKVKSGNRNLGALTPVAIYNPDSLSIVLKRIIIKPTPPPDEPTTPTLTSGSLADYLNSLPLSPDLSYVIACLSQLSGSELDNALDEISGVRTASLDFVENDAHSAITNLITNHTHNDSFQHLPVNTQIFAVNQRTNAFAILRPKQLPLSMKLLNEISSYIPYEARNGRIWVRAFGQAGRQDTITNLVGYRADTGGALIGFDNKINPDLLTGIGLGFVSNEIKWPTDGSKARIYNGVSTLYGTWYLYDQFYTDFSVTGSWNFYNIKRHISFPGVDRIASSHHPGFSITPTLGFGYKLNIDDIIYEPFILTSLNYMKERGLSESGAQSINLTTNSRSGRVLRNQGGLNISRRMYFSSGYWMINGGVSYVQKNPLGTSTLYSALQDQESYFAVNGYRKTRHFVAPTAGIGISYKSGISVGLDYYGEYDRSSNLQMIKAKLVYAL